MGVSIDHISQFARPIEPVLCWDRYTYFPVRYQLRDRDRVYGVSTRSGCAVGDAAADIDREFIPSELLGELFAGRVWVIMPSVQDVS
jgi:hypothetical protein